MLFIARSLLAWVVAIVGIWPIQAAAETLVLRADTRAASAWAAVRMLEDPSGELKLDDVLLHRSEFHAPEGPAENLGVRREAVWLKVPIRVEEGGPTQWVVSIDYPSLDEVDVYLLSGIGVVAHERLGDMFAFNQRAAASPPPRGVSDASAGGTA